MTEKNMFANQLKNLFKPFPSTISLAEEEEIGPVLDSIFQMDLSMNKFQNRKIQSITNEMTVKNAPGFDLITLKILKDLLGKGIKFITIIFNAIIRLEYFPDQWRVAQIKMISKPRKK